jgi:hypothetical protein
VSLRGKRGFWGWDLVTRGSCTLGKRALGVSQGIPRVWEIQGHLGNSGNSGLEIEGSRGLSKPSVRWLASMVPITFAELVLGAGRCRLGPRQALRNYLCTGEEGERQCVDMPCLKALKSPAGKEPLRLGLFPQSDLGWHHVCV